MDTMGTILCEYTVYSLYTGNPSMDTMGTFVCEYTVNPLYTGSPSMDTMGTIVNSKNPVVTLIYC